MGHEKPPAEEALSSGTGSNNEVTELKEKGNEAYKKDNLDEALAYYTQGTVRYDMVNGTVRYGGEGQRGLQEGQPR